MADAGQGTAGAITYGLQLDRGNQRRRRRRAGVRRRHRRATLRLPRHRPRRGQGRPDRQAPGHRPRRVRGRRRPRGATHRRPARLPPTSRRRRGSGGPARPGSRTRRPHRRRAHRRSWPRSWSVRCSPSPSRSPVAAVAAWAGACPVYPRSGIAFDWTVLGIGLGGAHRRSRSDRRSRWPIRAHPIAPPGARRPLLARTSKVGTGRRSTGLPAPAWSECASRSNRAGAAPRSRCARRCWARSWPWHWWLPRSRSASGLQTLVSRPALYGWNFSYLLNASNNTPPAALSRSSTAIPTSPRGTGYDYNIVEVDGRTSPFLIQDGQSTVKAPISPPILTGHAVDGQDQIVLGAATLAQLHKHLGDTVVVTYGAPDKRARLHPADPSRRRRHGHHARRRLLERASTTTPRWGRGRWSPARHLPAASGMPERPAADPTLNGPNLVFVELRSGVSRRGRPGRLATDR